MNRIAEEYVKLVLAVGQHDPHYVDAYYGPQAWADAAEKQGAALGEIRAAAEALVEQLVATDSVERAEFERLRHRYLRTQLGSLLARLRMLGGERLSFDDEARALYDAVPPRWPESHFREIIDELDPLLPGQGSLIERFDAFRSEFVIPPERLETVFDAAVDACRERTAEFVELPEGESFTVEYVTDQPWSGYNWYQGGFKSLIQVNTDLPIYIDRAVDLACHEGYPGHHAYNVLLEKHLVRDRGWVEFQVYPLFSPQSLIAEGTANYGIQVAFPGDTRIEFEREALFPLAGLDPEKADLYYRVLAKTEQLDYARNEAAREYLEGRIDAAAAAEWLTQYRLDPPERAQKSVSFIDRYRAYVINYNLGQDLVKSYVEGRGGTPDQPERRWEIFAELLASPRLPSSLD
ncbi:MAG: hypothetical protein GY716_02730 [bacterium]|nr:hypothetical protein [bacterium]